MQILLRRALFRLLPLLLPLALLHPSLLRAQDRRVGVILPLTGELASYGKKLQEGIEFAREQSHTKIPLAFEDGEFANTKALSAFHKLMGTLKPQVILGPFGPGQTLTLEPQAKAKNALLVAVSFCSEKFKPLDDVFCIYPGIRAQMEPLLSALADPKYKIETVAMLFEQLEESDSLGAVLRDFAKKKGAKLIFDERMPPEIDDFRGQLASIKSVDLFIAGGQPQRVLSAFRQLRELGVEPRFRLYATEQDARVFEENKALLEGVLLTGAFRSLDPNFRAAFERRFAGKPPDFYHALGFDAANYVFGVLSAEKGSWSLAATRAALLAHRREKTAATGFHFNPDRTVALRLAAETLHDGKPVPFE